jgi:hypothetical protein
VYSWPALDRFINAYRRAPAPTTAAAPCPPLGVAELASLLRAHLAEELILQPTPFEPLTAAEDAGEIQRQAAEALWESLICDLRA